MAFTENYAILNDCPLFWDPELLAQGRCTPRASTPSCRRASPSSPAAAAPATIRWFEAEPTYVLHWVNAYEEGDEIVLDGFFQGDPEPEDTGDGRPYRADVPLPRARPHADPAAPLAAEPGHRACTRGAAARRRSPSSA